MPPTKIDVVDALVAILNGITLTAPLSGALPNVKGELVTAFSPGVVRQKFEQDLGGGVKRIHGFQVFPAAGQGTGDGPNRQVRNQEYSIEGFISIHDDTDTEKILEREFDAIEDELLKTTRFAAPPVDCFILTRDWRWSGIAAFSLAGNFTVWRKELIVTVQDTRKP